MSTVNVPAATSSATQDASMRTASPTLISAEQATQDHRSHSRQGSISATVSSAAGTLSDAGTAGTRVTLPRDVIAKLEKSEAKEAKQVSKILVQEGKTTEKALSAAIKELGTLEKEHKRGAKGESSAEKAGMKAAKKAHKLEVAYLKAKSKYEQAQADIEAKAALLQTAKTHAATIHEKLQAKTKEVEETRQQKAISDRERSAKLEVLKAEH